jgi:hypothetical protein
LNSFALQRQRNSRRLMKRVVYGLSFSQYQRIT